MMHLDIEVDQKAAAQNGHDPLEARLRSLFAEQRRLRQDLERARAELDRINCEILQGQEDYCNDAQREDEYNRCLQKVLGVEPRFDLEAIKETGVGEQTLGDFIEELERQTNQSPSEEDR